MNVVMGYFQGGCAAFGLVSLLAMAGCGPSSGSQTPEPAPSQPYKTALALMCEVDARAGLDEESDPVAIHSSRNDWLQERVKNPDAIELMTLLRVRSGGEKAKMLLDQANAEGIQSCPLATSWEQDDE